MKKVLITGATGFVGRHVVEPLLERGYTVHGVSSRPATKPMEGIDFHQCDLLDSLQTRRLLEDIKPSHLLHLAWYTTPGQYWISAENLRWLSASIALVSAFRDFGGERAVFAGTCAEYDWRFGLCSEQLTPTKPSSLYGASKLALLTTMQSYADVAGFSLAWGRLFFLYGPHEQPSRLVSSVIQALLHRRESNCTAGTQIRDFQHVRDAAGAFAALLDDTLTGPVNIASGRPIQIKDVIYRIADRLDGHDLIRLGSRPAEPRDPPVVLADVRRLREELAWTDQYSLTDGIDETIAWWRWRVGTRP